MHSPSRHPTNDEYVVKFKDNDPGNPLNWSKYYKAWVTIQLGFMALTASLSSSIISPAEPVIAKEFHVSEEVTVLTVSLFVLGFAIGPLVWAPVSEVYGRKWSMLPAVALMGLFTIGTAVSRNIQSIIITRFFGTYSIETRTSILSFHDLQCRVYSGSVWLCPCEQRWRVSR